MSNQIIPTQPLVNIFNANIDGISQLAVNARDLHSFLNVGKVFAAWISERIEKYGFVENQDFILTVSKTGKRSNVTKKDYHLTLDTAKELAMVENNEQGRKVRRYFIECEKAIFAPRQTLSPKEQKALADKVRSLCQHDKKAYSGVWRAIKDHFGVERYQDILASDFENALAFLDTIAPPSPTDHPFFLSQNMAREFSARLKHIFDLAELVGDNKPAHLMKSRIKELHSFLYEYQKRNYPNNAPALP